MSAIPLPQFPPEFNPKCPKCSSKGLHFNFTKHPWTWGAKEIQYECNTCGTSGFGEDAVVARFTQQLVDWKRERAERAKSDQLRILQDREATARRERESAAAERAVEELRQIREAEAAKAAAAAAESARLAAWNAAEMKRRSEENAAMVAAALERRKQAARERRRQFDRERNLRRRAARQALREEAARLAPPAPPPAPKVKVKPPAQEPKIPVAPTEEEVARRLEEKRRRDREYRARVRAAARAAAAAEQNEVQLEVALPRAKDEGDCAWRDCDKPRDGKSKYCSRRCSNSNARWNSRNGIKA